MSKKNKRTINFENILIAFESLSKEEILESYDSDSLESIVKIYSQSYLIDEAIDACQLSLEKYPFNLFFHVELAKLYIADNFFIEALEIIDQGLSIDSDNLELNFLKVQMLSHYNNFGEAQSIINYLSQKLDRSNWSLLYVAQCHVLKAQKKYRKMFEYACKAVAIEFNSSAAFDILEKSIELSKCYKEAISFINEVIDEDPYNYNAWYVLAQAHAYSGNYERSILSYEYSFIANPDFLKAYIECAELCFELGYWRKALLINNDIVESFGGSADCYAQMAFCFLKLNKIDSAKKYLKKLSKIDPDHEELYLLLGDCHFAESNWKMAIASYKHGLEYNEEHDEYISKLARAYAKVGNFAEASSHFRLSVQLGPEQDAYWYYFAKYLIKEEKYDLADIVLNEADLYSFSAKLDYLRSIILLKTDKRSEALVKLSDALEEDMLNHKILFKYCPETRQDHQIQSMIKYFA